MNSIDVRRSVAAASLCIPYTSARFPSSYGIGSGDLTFSWDDLLWAAITIGRPNTAYVFQHGQASLYEAIFRLSLVRMALEQVSSEGRLHRTEAFKALDPTEKGAVSYFLGMAVCKLFAHELLNTHRLLHLDVFRDQLNPATLGGRSRPDLVGQDRVGAWHAFETKGRSSVPSSEDKQKAKAQAQRLVSVGGIPCTLHVGSFAYFRQDELEFYWRDPDPEEPEKLEPVAIDIADDDWVYYYESALALAIESQRPRLETDARATDLRVEIHPKIMPMLLEGQWAAAQSHAEQIRDTLVEAGYKPDGLRVIAGESWKRRFKDR